MSLQTQVKNNKATLKCQCPSLGVLVGTQPDPSAPVLSSKHMSPPQLPHELSDSHTTGTIQICPSV